MRLSAAGQAKEKDVVATLDEGSLAKRGKHLRHRRRQTLAVQSRERLFAEQVRMALVSFDAPPLAFLYFQTREMAKVLREGPAFALGFARNIVRVSSHRRQLQDA